MVMSSVDRLLPDSDQDLRPRPAPRGVRPLRSSASADAAVNSIAAAARRAGVFAGLWPAGRPASAVVICLDGRNWLVRADPHARADWLVTPVPSESGAHDGTAGDSVIRLPAVGGETEPATWWHQFLAGSSFVPPADRLGAGRLPEPAAGDATGHVDSDRASSDHSPSHAHSHLAQRAARTPAQVVAPLIDLARQVAAMATIEDALLALPRASLTAVPGAQHVAITRLRSRDRFATVASSDEVATQSDQVQYACQEGPCLDALLRTAVTRSTDLSVDQRWPRAGRRIADLRGVRSVLSTRLPLEGDKLALSVNLYSRETGAFDQEAENLAVLLAWQAALALRTVQERERADQLAIAVQTNRQIAKAIGLLMAQRSIADTAAFDLMRAVSQRTHRRLNDLAEEIVRSRDSSCLDLPELAAGDGASPAATIEKPGVSGIS